MITDMELIRSSHPSTVGDTTYAVTYDNGRVVTFVVDNMFMARRYGHEFGVRFMGGRRVMSVRVAGE